MNGAGEGWDSAPVGTQADDGRERGRVLVADDDAAGRRLLRTLLEPEGHEVLEADDGPAALACAEAERPDVVLLDVVMPRLSGFDVCRQLKTQPELAATPVLLVTGLSRSEDRAAGMAAGADDFLSKPIDTRTAPLRIRNAVRMKRLHDRVRADVKRLEELERLRQSLTQMIVHDMRGPLTGISGYLELMEQRTDGSDAARKILRSAGTCTDRLTRMANDLLDVSRLEEGKMPLRVRRSRLDVIAAEAGALLGQAAGDGRFTLVAKSPNITVACDVDLIRRVIANLVGNALRFSPQDKAVEVSIGFGDGHARVEVSDQGPGIAPKYQQRVFEKFVQLEARREGEVHSSGLGLTFCKLVVEAHHGRIGLCSEVGRGSMFWFELPSVQEIGIAL
jgi:two-component system, sensor histidine kinase and response regulator